MHKSEEYGTILLKQSFKQSSEQIQNFASQIAIFLPFSSEVIHRSINQLVNEEVLKIDGDLLFQKRMVKDGKLSETRALSGSKGGIKSKEFTKKFATAKTQANSENEIVIENENTIENIKKKVDKKFNFKNSLIESGFNSDLVNEWCSIREKKKAVNSEKAFKDFLTEVEKTGIEKNVILEYITDGSRQWKGFKATWYLKDQPQSNIKPNTEPTRNFDLS